MEINEQTNEVQAETVEEQGQEVSPDTGENTEETFSEESEEVDEQQALDQSDDGVGNTDTFSREYVEKLRKENADSRVKAKRADELERRLHSALVAADGRLADPADLEFNAEHLEDPDALETAIAELVQRKPGLRSRQYAGDVGAGARGTTKPPTVDLIQLMRGN